MQGLCSYNPGVHRAKYYKIEFRIAKTGSTKCNSKLWITPKTNHYKMFSADIIIRVSPIYMIDKTFCSLMFVSPPRHHTITLGTFCSTRLFWGKPWSYQFVVRVTKTIQQMYVFFRFFWVSCGGGLRGWGFYLNMQPHDGIHNHPHDLLQNVFPLKLLYFCYNMIFVYSNVSK